MPFRVDIATNANDLIYGLAEPRSLYSLPGNPFHNRGMIYIDQFAVLPFERPPYGTKIMDNQLIARYQLDAKYGSALHSNTNEAVRRKCKGGIKFGIECGKNIHFVLDGLEYREVCEKSGFRNNGIDVDEGISRSVTGAELRWVYRNKITQGVLGQVQFWFNGNRCQAPWETDNTIRTLFQIYRPTQDEMRD
ncbi:hypothetical protein FNU76_02290 [Chitinimonas arctica]|uniref:Uncharacterized protein n=1 Tax=Chitinimonas arctica TaxID=2594795 RepID=A0A516SAU6_9NEIS|nr:hypothetical protein [Chitinimonas arctica]QDQ25273.1 hypothetical protein FNU76_02290 [Chitinimonas arctica]